MNYFLRLTFLIVNFLFSGFIFAQIGDSLDQDSSAPEQIKGMHLVWHDEFNVAGKPDSTNWNYENGFVRNKELQWYQSANASCKNGVLVIEGRKEQIKNPKYIAGSMDWRTNREFASYTSASIRTKGLQQWLYGRFEIRARIDSTTGSWPAIWTLGINGPWPSNGEVDMMEFYRITNVPTILANTAWGTDRPYVAKWNSAKKPLANFLSNDPDWIRKFHIWRMDWDKDSIKLYIDNALLTITPLSGTINADGKNPFQQPHYLLLNLALGANGGEPVNAPVRYEVDYVRVYQKGISDEVMK